MRASQLLPYDLSGPAGDGPRKGMTVEWAVDREADRQVGPAGKGDLGCAPEVASRPRASLLRCPYCHAEVSATLDEGITCAACLARHHATCWSEAARCAACAGAVPLGVVAPLPPAPPAPEAVPVAAGAWCGGFTVAEAPDCLPAFVLSRSFDGELEEPALASAAEVVLAALRGQRRFHPFGRFEQAGRTLMWASDQRPYGPEFPPLLTVTVSSTGGRTTVDVLYTVTGYDVFSARRRPRDEEAPAQGLSTHLVGFTAAVVGLVAVFVLPESTLEVLAFTVPALVALLVIGRHHASQRGEAVRRNLAELTGVVEAVERKVAALARARKGC